MKYKLKRILCEERGDATYTGVIIFTVIAMITVVFLLNVMSVVMMKSELDAAADQVARQIQLAGGVDSDTEDLIDYLRNGINAENIEFVIDTNFITAQGSNTCIQIGTPFYLTVTADTKLGGFFTFADYPLKMTSRAAGVSEVYWK